VRIRIRRLAGEIAVEISNSGAFVEASKKGGCNGVGLANVRRRLALCYGKENNLEISSVNDITAVRFSIPVTASLETVLHSPSI
jgi:LytS/YehU family sensor histidine kinase